MVIKRTQSGKIDKRTKEGREMVARMAKARRAKAAKEKRAKKQLINRIARLLK